MMRKSLELALALGALTLAAPPSPAQQQDSPADWRSVEEALGVSGSMQPGEVFKVTMPRTDLDVTADGVAVEPALALTSWLAFKREDAAGGEATVMGDLVLTEDEVNPVLSTLEGRGIEAMALHHHLYNLSPNVMFMHVRGRGDAVELAEALRAGLEETGTPLDGQSGQEQQATPGELPLDTAKLDDIIGYQGHAGGGVYHYGIPRAEEVTAAGTVVPPPMGTATALNFQPTGEGKAAITGDFVMTAEEVNPVIRALREHGIQVMALHNHMLTDEPRLFFMHFWANDDATELARGLRAALDEMNLANP